MENYFKRNCFILLFILLASMACNSLQAMDGAGMAFKVSLSGKYTATFPSCLRKIYALKVISGKRNGF